MEKEARVIQLLQRLAQSGRGQIFFTATVKSIEGNTCTIEIEQDFTISDVRLKPTTDELPDDIILTPAIGSSVLVGSLSGDFSNLFVLQSDTISEALIKIGSISLKINKDGIVANGGENGGIVLSEKVKSELDTVIERVNNIANAFTKIATAATATEQTPVLGASLGTFITSNITDIVSPLAKPQKTVFENSKITH